MTIYRASWWDGHSFPSVDFPTPRALVQFLWMQGMRGMECSRLKIIEIEGAEQ